MDKGPGKRPGMAAGNDAGRQGGGGVVPYGLFPGPGTVPHEEGYRGGGGRLPQSSVHRPGGDGKDHDR